MSGKPGRSGGHNRLSAAEHLRRGTWNVTRHGPKPSQLVPAVAGGDDAPLDDGLLTGVGTRGREFCEVTYRRYTGWSPPGVVLLVEAAHLVDRLDSVRGQKGEQAVQRTVLGALQLRE